MVSESVNSNESLGGYLAFPAITTGFGALTSVKRNGGVKKAVEELKTLRKMGIDYNDALKQTHKDIFSRSIAVADNYEIYKNALKEQHKLAKLVKKGSIGLIDKVKNQFKKLPFVKGEQVTLETISKNSDSAKEKFELIEADIKKGVDVAAKEASEEAAKDGAKAVIKTGGETTAKAGLLSTTKNLFLKEIKSPLTIGLTVISSLPEFFGKVVPKYKEEGAKEGLKETGKWGLKVGADLFSFAAGGAIGRTVGAIIGNFLCPFVGAGVGGAVGSMIGAMFLGSKTLKAVEKITGEDEKQSSEENELQTEQNKNQNIQTAQMPQQAQKINVVDRAENIDDFAKTGSNLRLSA